MGEGLLTIVFRLKEVKNLRDAMPGTRYADEVGHRRSVVCGRLRIRHPRSTPDGQFYVARTSILDRLFESGLTIP